MNKKDLKFIRKGKILIIVFALLSVFNIILLINNKSYALFRRTVSSKKVIEIHAAKEISLIGEPLLDKLNANLTPSNYVTDSDGTKFLSGSDDTINFNYVWYSGKLWRITAINPDNTIKMITQDEITAIFWNANTTYSKTTWIYQWLNEDFLDTLYNQEYIIAQNVKWNVKADGNDTPIKPEETEKTTVYGNVGLLNAYEYYQSYKNTTTVNGYLNIKYKWWLITPYNDTNVRYVHINGVFFDASPASEGAGVRPVVNLNSNITISGGNGTKENPYRIERDKKVAKINNKLNSRLSGEYVNFDGKKYRIVGIENETTKLTSIDYLRDDNKAVIQKYFSDVDTDVLYGSGTTTSENNWAGYLKNTWYENINDRYKNMLVEGTYYLGTVARSSYKNSICSKSNTTERTKTCDKTSSTWQGLVGLPRVGEMFSAMLKNDYGNTSIYVELITPYSSSAVITVFRDGNLHSVHPTSYEIGVRPSITLNSNVVITSGEGTEQRPYEIKCDTCGK